MFSSIMMMTMIPKMWNEYTFQSANVQKFIKSTGLEFDVIVAEDFVSESIYYFAHKHKAPLITICKFSIGCEIRQLWSFIYVGNNCLFSSKNRSIWSHWLHWSPTRITNATKFCHIYRKIKRIIVALRSMFMCKSIHLFIHFRCYPIRIICHSLSAGIIQ